MSQKVMYLTYKTHVMLCGKCHYEIYFDSTEQTSKNYVLSLIRIDINWYNYQSNKSTGYSPITLNSFVCFFNRNRINLQSCLICVDLGIPDRYPNKCIIHSKLVKHFLTKTTYTSSKQNMRNSTNVDTQQHIIFRALLHMYVTEVQKFQPTANQKIANLI